MERFEPRISIVTLGVENLDASKAFYQAIGWTACKAFSDGVAFFQLKGTVLGLYPRNKLAEDAEVSDQGAGFRGVALAHNLSSEAEVDAAMAHAVSCGAKCVKQPEKVFWGGYSGYFSDPDGHLWELAFNPFAPFDKDGHLMLPD